MKVFKLNAEYIKLQQFLKYEGFIDIGGAAKAFIAENEIFLNGESVKERGKKLKAGDILSVNGEQYIISSELL